MRNEGIWGGGNKESARKWQPTHTEIPTTMTKAVEGKNVFLPPSRPESVAERFLACHLELILSFLTPSTPQEYASVAKLEYVNKMVGTSLSLALAFILLLPRSPGVRLAFHS